MYYSSVQLNKFICAWVSPAQSSVVLHVDITRTCTIVVLHENFLYTTDFYYSDIKLSFPFTRGVDSTPPGGLLNFLNKNTPKHGPVQVVINGS